MYVRLELVNKLLRLHKKLNACVFQNKSILVYIFLRVELFKKLVSKNISHLVRDQ